MQLRKKFNLKSLFFLLIYTPFSLADIHCDVLEDQSQAPSADDCYQIIAHLPALPPTDLRTAPGQRVLSASSPFLPNTAFRHGDCLITTDFSTDTDSTGHLSNPLDVYMNMLSHTPAGGSLRPEVMFFMVWTLIRDLARRVVEECVEGRHIAGDGDGGFSVPVVEGGMRWNVAVTGTGKGEWIEEHLVSPSGDMRRFVEWGQQPGSRRRRRQIFDYAFFSV